jgi:glycosyltransferase involved in cell wall biosynthesis
MELPSVSIIVPCFNEEECLGECLGSLLGMNYPVSKWEIIVVDNNSTDHSAQIAKSYPVCYLFEPNPGPSAARNRGAEVAKGEILAFVDADCIVEENWLQEICRPLMAGQADIAQSLREGLDANLWARLRQRQHQSFIARLRREADDVGLTTTDGLVIRKDVFVDLGGLNETFLRSEDIELSVRFHRQGYRAVFVPSARIKHINPTSLSEILHVREREGFFTFKIIRMCSREEREKFFPESCRWYYRILSRWQPADWLVLNVFVRTSQVVIGLLTCLLILLRALGLGDHLYPLFAFTVDLSFFRGKVLAKLSEVTDWAHSNVYVRSAKPSYPSMIKRRISE